MSDRGVLPRGESKFRTNGGGRSSIVASILPPRSSVPLRDEVDALLREKLDLHSELFEAAQIQRKLSGPREFRQGGLQFASEVFAARFLSGDFTTFLKSGSKVLMAHGAQFYTLLKVFRRLSVISLQNETCPIIGFRQSCVLEQSELSALQGLRGIFTALESRIKCTH